MESFFYRFQALQCVVICQIEQEDCIVIYVQII